MVKTNGKGPQEKNIQVFVRCRPLNDSEKKKGSHKVVDVLQSKKDVQVNIEVAEKATSKTFSFDKAFGPNAKQIEVYKTVVLPILDEVLMGYNCTVFAYGQTGTGKTFTMEGERTPDPTVSWEEDPLAGIIPRAMHQIFEKLQRAEVEFSVRVSFMELYNEELFDLLTSQEDTQRLRIFEDSARKGSVVIQGLEEIVVHNKNEVYAILEKGAAKRQTAATLMNAHSSRSHSVFTVTIHIKENSVDGEELLKTGKLNLVDLAGSENIGRSGAVDKRAREAGNINQSLLTLGRVITALVEFAPHVPYRESKLTRLLQDSLGGRTKTSIIATISPSLCNVEETLSTLDYAHRAKNITNRPEINQKLTKRALIKEYTEEIERLRRDLIATREKNGIFLSEEHYRSMEQSISSQALDIQEKSDKIAALLDEITKINDILSDTKEELKETSSQLETTTKTLVHTTTTLQKTETDLRVTITDRDQKHFLLGEHVKTEEKLSSEAEKLLSVAESTTADLEGVHAKLDRKCAVEFHNATVQQTFEANLADQLQTVQDTMSDFGNVQQKCCSVLQDNFKGFAASHFCEVESMCSSITSMIDNLEDQAAAITTDAHQEHDSWHEWNKQTTEQIAAFSADHSSKVEGFLQEAHLPLLRRHRELLRDHSQCLTEWNQKVQAQIESQKMAVDTFLQSSCSQLDSLAALLGDYITKQKKVNQGHRQRAANMLAVQKETGQKLKAQVMAKMSDVIQHMLDQQHEQSTDNLNEMTDSYSTLIDCADSAESKLQGCLGDLRKTSETFAGQYVEGSEKLTEATDDHTKKSQSCISEEEASCNQIEESIQDYFTEELSHQDAHAAQMTEAIETHTQALDRHIANTNQQTEAMVSMLRQNAGDHKRNLINQHDSLTATLDQWGQQVTQQSTHVNDRICDLRVKVTDVEGLAVAFLKEELRQDVPTGVTPKNRRFSYPRQLTRTEPHEHLLKNFGLDRTINEASNVPLPDTFIEEPEEGKSEVVETTSVNGDDISEAGSDVSMGSLIIDDGKENFAKPSKRKAQPGKGFKQKAPRDNGANRTPRSRVPLKVSNTPN